MYQLNVYLGRIQVEHVDVVLKLGDVILRYITRMVSSCSILVLLRENLLICYIILANTLTVGLLPFFPFPFTFYIPKVGCRLSTWKYISSMITQVEPPILFFCHLNVPYLEKYGLLSH